MRLHIIILSTIIFLSLGIIITNVSSLGKENLTEAVTTQKTTYTLKDYNGQIALFKNNDEKPTEIYNIFINSLPKADIENIKNGITVETKEELNKLLEDYLG